MTPARLLEVLEHVEQHSCLPDNLTEGEHLAIEDLVSLDVMNQGGQNKVWSLTTLGELELEDLLTPQSV